MRSFSSALKCGKISAEQVCAAVEPPFKRTVIVLKNNALNDLPREELLRLIELYSKNWLALDGVWFQSVEKKRGMDEAMEHDAAAWSRFTRIEAKRIKEFLGLPEPAGLEGLAAALSLRFYANLNRAETIIQGNTLVYRTLECRVQRARAGKGMPFHPCKLVGLIEYTGFAQVIDPRFRCECLSCYPDITDPDCSCAWLFTLADSPAASAG